MRRLLASPAFRALIALVLVLALGAIFSADGAFFRLGTHRDTLRQISVYGMLACGMTLVIVSAGIDLSVGSILALVAVVFSLTTIQWGWSPWISVPFSLLVGTACGGISGALVSWGKLQPFIATLAMMVFARGLAKTASGGTKVSTVVVNPDGTFRSAPIPPVMRFLNSTVFGGSVAVVTILLAGAIVVCWLALSRMTWGRRLFAIGGNETAARASGVPVNWSKWGAYAASGVLAGLAGISQAVQEQQGDPEAGIGYELTAIAMVVIGGTNLMGGRGGIGLTVIGMLTIGYLEKILSINAVPEAARLMLTGAIIVVSVLAQRTRGR